MSSRRCKRTSAVKIRVDDSDFAAALEATQRAVGHKAVAMIELLVIARGESYWDGKRLVPASEVLES